MSIDEMDEAMLAEVRRVLDEAALVLDEQGKGSTAGYASRVRYASGAIFAALARRDEQVRKQAATMEIVRAVAAMSPWDGDSCLCVFCNMPEAKRAHAQGCTFTQARALLAQEVATEPTR